MNQPIAPLEKRLLLLATILLIAGQFVHLGTQPLYLEEPRRAIVSMELLENNNYLVPTLLGDYYYNKPPFFNWVLLASVHLFGGFQEWALRLPTVVSLLLWAALIFVMGRRFGGARFGWYSALLLLTCGAFLYYFSLIAEIDIFYSLLTFASMAFFYYGYQKQRWLGMFSALYGLAAIGFLTKGLPSIAFAGLTVLVWLGYHRDWRRLFGWQHLVGGLLFLVIAGTYYYGYAQYHDPLLLLDRLWSESSDRTVAGDQGTGTFLLHLLRFPVNFWANLLPTAGLLLFFVFGHPFKQIKRSIQAHPFLLFSLLMLAAHLAIYWLSPGSRMRYVYTLFPFAIFLLVWFWLQPKHKTWPERAFRVSAGLLIHTFPLGAVAILFVPDLDFLPGRVWIAGLFTALFLVCVWLFWRKPANPAPGSRYTMLALLIGIALSRWLFACTVLPQRDHAGGAYENRQRAEVIHQLTQNRPVHTHGEDKVIAYTSIFYLNRLREKTVRRRDTLTPGRYYLITHDSAWHPQADTLLEYQYNGLEQMLIHLPED